MNRRTFLAGTGAAAVTGGAGYAGWRKFLRPPPPRRFGDLVLERGPAGSQAPDVLFITLDDCNDWLGYLNPHPGTHTPNLDALAAASLTFDHAYCTAPMCLPSRTSVMFGSRPDSTGIYDHTDESRAAYGAMSPRSASLVDEMWAGGYDVVCAGKVFNDSQGPRWNRYRASTFYADPATREDPDLQGFTFDPEWRSGYDGSRIVGGPPFTPDMIDWGPSGKEPDQDPDGAAATWVLEQLRNRSDRPMFMAWGLLATHLPWRISQRYFDLHPLEGIELPYVPKDDLDDIPAYARKSIVDTLKSFERIQRDDRWKQVVQAYMAAISYMDDEIGRVLDGLASLPGGKDTIVVLWSDHGFHLGEKLHLQKLTLWERATHVPLILHVPGRFDGGQRFAPPVSLLDVGPTVAELTGTALHTRHEGQSLLPLIAEPELADARAPITTWRAGNHAVRSGPFRYIRYTTGEAELYDHRTDPGELVNLAGQPGSATDEKRLAALLPTA